MILVWAGLVCKGEKVLQDETKEIWVENKIPENPSYPTPILPQYIRKVQILLKSKRRMKLKRARGEYRE